MADLAPRNEPAVSVLLPVHEREPFLLPAVESVLAQTLGNLELIIACSETCERHRETLASVTDPRVRWLLVSGESTAQLFNEAVAAANGSFIALMSADSVARPDRLEKQHEAASQSSELSAFFSHIGTIDDRGRSAGATHELDFYNLPALTRAELTRRMLIQGNLLCAATFFAPRRAILDSGGMDPTFTQIHDFDLWLKLLKRMELRIIPLPLLDIRIHDEKTNQQTYALQNALRAELFLLAGKFFDGMNDDQLKEAFPSLAAQGSRELTPIRRRAVEALLLFQGQNPAYRLQGASRLHALFNDADSKRILEKEFKFPLKAFTTHLKYNSLIDAHTTVPSPDLREVALQAELVRVRLAYFALQKKAAPLIRAHGRVSYKLLSLFLRKFEKATFARSVIKSAVHYLLQRANATRAGQLRLNDGFRRDPRSILSRWIARAPGVAGSGVAHRLLRGAFSANAFDASTCLELCCLSMRERDDARAFLYLMRAFLIDRLRFCATGEGRELLKNQVSSSPAIIRAAVARIIKDDSLLSKEALAFRASRKPPLALAPTNRVFPVVALETLCDDPGRGHLEVLRHAQEFEFRLPAIFEEAVSSEPYRVPVPASTVATLKNVRLIPGYGILQENRLVVYEPAAHPKVGHVAGCHGIIDRIPGSPELAWIQYHPRRSGTRGRAILVSGRCSTNYFHWMIEYLPKLLEIERSPGLRDLPLVISHDMPLQHYQALMAVLAGSREFLYFDSETELDFEELHVPSVATYIPDDFDTPYWRSAAMSEEHIRFLRERVLQSAASIPPEDRISAKRIYLSRRTVSNRSLTNQAEIERLFVEAGFLRVFPEQLSFLDQVNLFNQADVIVGPTGANFTNLAFCKPGALIVGLTSERNKAFCNFANLAAANGARFLHVTGPNNKRRDEFESEEEFAHSSFSIPLEKIRRVIPLCKT